MIQKMLKRTEFHQSKAKVVDFTDFEEAPLTEPPSTFRRLDHEKQN